MQTIKQGKGRTSRILHNIFEKRVIIVLTSKSPAIDPFRSSTPSSCDRFAPRQHGSSWQRLQAARLACAKPAADALRALGPRSHGHYRADALVCICRPGQRGNMLFFRFSGVLSSLLGDRLVGWGGFFRQAG